MKRCYYQILEVEPKATTAEIKTSYRKLALKFHPDKNSDENAKQKFVEINEAYNVLSDPNERTWYDTNREKILFNKEEMSKEDIQMYSFGFNVWNYFTVACFKGYQDQEGAFFQVYREIFEKIKTQETKSFKMREDLEEEEPRKYEGFGDSKTIEEKMLRFYQDWENFTTYKSFIWSEEWDTRDANNRWVRREMEKENKKQRQAEKKTYIKTVKDLVAFVKKRDPRYRDYMIKVKEEEDKKALEKIEKEKEKKKEKEDMKVVKQQLQEERFKEIEEYYKKQNQDSTQNNHQHYEEEDQSEFYCQACEKAFKSENQLKNHEKSKNHKQMLKDIEKQVLLKEDILKKVEEQDNEPEIKEEKEVETAKTKKKKNKKNNNQTNLNTEKIEDDEPKNNLKKQQPKTAKNMNNKNKPDKESSEEKPSKQKPLKESSSDDDHDNFMNNFVKNKTTKIHEDQINANATKDTNGKQKKQKMEKKNESQNEESEEENKIGMAKLKKMKKSEQQEKAKAVGNKCNVCKQTFNSKTKLFEHVNKSGHASAK